MDKTITTLALSEAAHVAAAFLFDEDIDDPLTPEEVVAYSARLQAIETALLRRALEQLTTILVQR